MPAVPQMGCSGGGRWIAGAAAGGAPGAGTSAESDARERSGAAAGAEVVPEPGIVLEVVVSLTVAEREPGGLALLELLFLAMVRLVVVEVFWWLVVIVLVLPWPQLSRSNLA